CRRCVARLLLPSVGAGASRRPQTVGVTMIRKIVTIRNVGKFCSYGASGDVELRRLTIVFGENGRGKTTLAAIFRSLRSGSPHHVLERQTLNGGAPPEVSLLLGGGLATFGKGAWSAPHPDI